MNKKSFFWGTTSDGIKVYDRPNSHFHFEGGLTKEKLAKALAKVALNGENFKEFTVDMQEVVGHSICVEITNKDDVEMFKRKGREGLTPMVFHREPVETSYITLVLKKTGDTAILITAFTGEKAPREPWDKNILTPTELKESIEFWNTHALIYDERMIER